MAPYRSFPFVYVCMILLSLCFLSFPLVSSAPSLPRSGHIVLIDAGSTGSRVHVHTYEFPSSSPSSLPLLGPSNNKKIKIGLSSFALNPEQAALSIRDQLDFARSAVPESDWSNTPIHLQATAGLRSITAEQAEAILEVVRDELERSGFMFKREWARIISGEQEGLNGWVAANYLMGSFEEENSKEKSSYGVVEMGGTSMQITFEPFTVSEQSRKNLVSLSIGGRNYHLYTHSFLPYGLQAAQKLYQQTLIDSIEEHGNPCYPKGYRFTSLGNYDQCYSLLTKVVDKSKSCKAESCSFNGIYQPTIENEPFLAIENFFYTLQFFGYNSANMDNEENNSDGTDAAGHVHKPDITTGEPLLEVLEREGRKYCELTWEQIRARWPDADVFELSQKCFSAAYEAVVLEHGLGFNERSNIRPAKTVEREKGEKQSIEWEIGAALLQLVYNNNYGDVVPAEVQQSQCSKGAADLAEIPSSSGECVNCSYYYFFALLFVLTIAAYTYLICTRKAVLPSFMQNVLSNGNTKRGPTRGNNTYAYHNVNSANNVQNSNWSNV